MSEIRKLSDRTDALERAAENQPGESFHLDQIKTMEEFDLRDGNLSVDADRMEAVNTFNIYFDVIYLVIFKQACFTILLV